MTWERCLVGQVDVISCGRYGSYILPNVQLDISRLQAAYLIHNMLTHLSGCIGAFDKWAKQVGDESYKFANLLPFFQKTAKFSPTDSSQRPKNATAQYNASDWSPDGGPVQVGYSSWVNPVSSWLGLAFKKLALKELPSLLSDNLLGWSWLPLELDPVTQTRSSSTAFLREALEQTTNLAVYKSTLAKRILFENKMATGVSVDSGGIAYRINAKKEIVLSAGVVLTAD